MPIIIALAVIGVGLAVIITGLIIATGILERRRRYGKKENDV